MAENENTQNNENSQNNDESILISIKKLLGLASENDSFDTDVIIHINSALMVLNQLGVGPEEGFSIKSSSEVWSDFIEDTEYLDAVKTYIYLKVKIVFDPPQHGPTEDALKESIKEYEWRLNVKAENAEKGV